MNRHDREQIDRIEFLLQRLDSAVVVRDPGSARAAEAFDGLRKSVIQASKSHRVHVAHLIALDESIRSGGTIDLVRFRVAEYLRELGIERLEKAEIPEAFDITGDKDGEIEVLEAAIVERADDGRISVLRVGKANRTALPIPMLVVPESRDVDEGSLEAPHETMNTMQAKKQPGRGMPRPLVAILGVVLAAVLLLAVRTCGADDSVPQPGDGTTSTTVTIKSDN